MRHCHNHYLSISIIFFFSILFSASCQNAQPLGGSACSGKTCHDGEVCRVGKCKKLCVNHNDCKDLGSCIRGACEPVQCQQSETNCTDTIDNDCDGFIDSNDTECLLSNGSTLTGTSNCFGSPPKCGEFGVCAESFGLCVGENYLACNLSTDVPDYQAVETSCADGKDNDCDNLVDCDDSNCANNWRCKNPGCLIPEGQDNLFEDHEVSCFDSNDNDCDTQIDCNDSDCKTLAECQVCQFDQTGQINEFCECEEVETPVTEEIFTTDTCVSQWNSSPYDGGNISCGQFDGVDSLKMEISGRQTGVPIIWKNRAFPDKDIFGWEVRFKFFNYGGYGNSFSMGTNENYAGNRVEFSWDSTSFVGGWPSNMDDVFWIKSGESTNDNQHWYVNLIGQNGKIDNSEPPSEYDEGWRIVRVILYFSTKEASLEIWKNNKNGDPWVSKRDAIDPIKPNLVVFGHPVFFSGSWEPQGYWTNFAIDYFNIFYVDLNCQTKNMNQL